MTAPLRDLLDELADAAPEPRVSAETLWTAGRRERRQRGWSRVTVAAAVLALLALVVPLAPATAPGFAVPTTVQGHPERVTRQLWVPDLPRRPGPVAGLLDRVSDGGGFDQPEGWEAVAPDGTRWAVPSNAQSQEPTLSPDGRLLGYLRSLEAPFVVRDLVTGRETVFPDVGANILPKPRRYALGGPQIPFHWSPDAQRLAVSGDGVVVMDVRDGSARRLTTTGLLAGWRDDDRVLTTTDARSPTDPADPSGDVAVRTYRVSTGALESTVVLRGRADLGPLARLTQWTAVVTADRREVVLVGEDAFDATYGVVGVRRFELASGRETTVGTPEPLPLASICGPTAISGGGAVAVPVAPEPGERGLRVHRVERDGSSRVAVEVEAGTGGTCTQWAGDALAGEPRSRALPWWAPLVGGPGLLGVLLVVLHRRRRARRDVVPPRQPLPGVR